MMVKRALLDALMATLMVVACEKKKGERYLLDHQSSSGRPSTQPTCRVATGRKKKEKER